MGWVFSCGDFCCVFVFILLLEVFVFGVEFWLGDLGVLGCG